VDLRPNPLAAALSVIPQMYLVMPGLRVQARDKIKIRFWPGPFR
jgi:hypothetical protein